MASITVRLVAGLNILASRLCIPQSSPPDPFSGYGSAYGGTAGKNRSPSVRLSLSAIGPPSAARMRLRGGRLVPGRDCRQARSCARGPPQRVEQAILGEFEHPRVDLVPPRVAVGIGGRGGRVRLESGRALAQVAFELGQAGVEPGALACAQRGA